MQIRSSMIMVPLLATILASQVAHAIGEPSFDARVTATTGSSRAQLAVLPAPVGHRQPTLDDLPPWLRQIEKPGPQAVPRKTWNRGERPGDGLMTAFLKFANLADVVLVRDSPAVQRRRGARPSLVLANSGFR
jgi:hypothetical protein